MTFILYVMGFLGIWNGWESLVIYADRTTFTESFNFNQLIHPYLAIHVSYTKALSLWISV